MSDNPLEPNKQRDAEIKARAEHLWQEAGSPKGRMDEFIERADELVRMEHAGLPGQLPIDTRPVIEEASIQENLGEFPTASGMSDQGDRRETPMTREELRHPTDDGDDKSR